MLQSLKKNRPYWTKCTRALDGVNQQWCVFKRPRKQHAGRPIERNRREGRARTVPPSRPDPSCLSFEESRNFMELLETLNKNAKQIEATQTRLHRCRNERINAQSQHDISQCQSLSLQQDRRIDFSESLSFMEEDIETNTAIISARRAEEPELQTTLAKEMKEQDVLWSQIYPTTQLYVNGCMKIDFLEAWSLPDFRACQALRLCVDWHALVNHGSKELCDTKSEEILRRSRQRKIDKQIAGSSTCLPLGIAQQLGLAQQARAMSEQRALASKVEHLRGKIEDQKQELQRLKDTVTRNVSLLEHTRRHDRDKESQERETRRNRRMKFRESKISSLGSAELQDLYEEQEENLEYEQQAMSARFTELQNRQVDYMVIFTNITLAEFDAFVWRSVSRNREIVEEAEEYVLMIRDRLTELGSSPRPRDNTRTTKPTGGGLIYRRVSGQISQRSGRSRVERSPTPVIDKKRRMNDFRMNRPLRQSVTPSQRSSPGNIDNLADIDFYSDGRSKVS